MYHLLGWDHPWDVRYTAFYDLSMNNLLHGRKESRPALMKQFLVAAIFPVLNTNQCYSGVLWRGFLSNSQYEIVVNFGYTLTFIWLVGDHVEQRDQSLTPYRVQANWPKVKVTFMVKYISRCFYECKNYHITEMPPQKPSPNILLLYIFQTWRHLTKIMRVFR